MTTPKNTPDFEALIRQFHHAEGSALAPLSPEDRPLHGQTLYLASCELEMRFGSFRAHIFQDIIDKHYLIALAHGDITSAEPLHIRMHSSCVTSETLRGCDCDCVEQLESALVLIAKKRRGILFYLMQEGRGVGYAAKARDRMIVQASGDRLTTFDAYASMGLKKDHRHYDNISQICHLLGIRAPFNVLTNNPDKVAALRAQGIPIAATEPLEVEPSPFNLAYLTSKATCGGHNLKRPTVSKVRRAAPPEPVDAFRPHALANARRFIYAASYFLPIKQVDDCALLTGEQYQKITDAHRALILEHTPLRDNRHLVKISPAALAAHRKANPGDTVTDLLAAPYWFRTHVYYDIVTCQEHVVLTHGQPRAGDIPVVRLHSEALFNRFPLRTAANRDKMKQSVKHIITYGCGALLLIYNDGRGAGFGAYATDLMMTQTGQARTTDESYRKLGISYDSRDYDAAMLLLRQHIPNEKIQMVMNNPDSLVKKNEYIAALKAHAIDVDRWIFLDEHPVYE
ncbi:3,4-dihydroxy 2-butanone 4-phosphate synthase/GTP cyclohydrolase II [Ereboglobus sp. PH5-10]|uniref:GTP cyclohydrolase n=1 Tax=Ereboglobus sp. PH5-10 TaxID=2940629 RepID=UPI002406C38A|nr:GTP cyclohydrolase [Ereboglobus sp. PH5-10]MDF9826216.1 3,4-dihydroxy 2-butanone 4-phosphate synthase/GTP cyclohydrolase II [Ereboglobus sp. PH5-10]